MVCSEDSTESTLDEGPKLFILVVATSFKGNPLLLGVSSQGCNPGRNRFFYFLLLGIILLSDKDNALSEG